MTFKASSGETRPMTKQEMSGDMNEDYTHPNVVAKVTDSGAVVRGLSDYATKRGVTAPLVITDISAEQHGSWLNGVYTPNEVHGFPYKTRPVE
jgi:hypothetical protein